MHSTNYLYKHDEISLHGFVAYDDTQQGPRPLVLIAHDWTGRNEFACLKAEKLATLGYVGFALDMYGEGRQGETNEEKTALMQPFMVNRRLLRNRVKAAYDAALKLPEVNPNKIGIIGFCFGGLCALDLARSGTPLTGVVSFHGLLKAPETTPEIRALKTKVLALHGYDDPMVSPEQINDFALEMTALNADWQIHMYGQTKHAFTNPLADDPEFGTVYNKTADFRAWRTMVQFFDEIF